MRQRNFIAVPLLVIAGLLASAPVGWTQETCQEIRALTPLVFDMSLGTYVGPVFAALGTEALVGKVLTDKLPTTTCQGSVCQDRDARYRFDLGNGDSFTVEVQHAAYNEPPGIGDYRAVEKIVGGTGRFQQATGVLVEAGPFLAWIDSTSQVQSRYNGELRGKICNVLPRRP